MNNQVGRRALRKLYDSASLSWVRALHFDFLFRKEASTSSIFSRQLGYKTLSTESSELGLNPELTFFILGSGSSVNELTPADFAVINKNNSVGINVWVAHDFVPNIYSFESDHYDAPPPESLKFLSRTLDKKLRSNLHVRLLLLRPKRVELRKRMVEVDPKFRGQIYMYGRQNLQSRLAENLLPDVMRVLRKLRTGALPQNVALDNGASATRMAYVALALGFKRIVFCGIDLNTGPYFWDLNDPTGTNQVLSGYFPRPSGVPHDTTLATGRPYSNLDFLVALGQSAERLLGATFQVSSRSSALAEHFAVYSWTDK